MTNGPSDSEQELQNRRREPRKPGSGMLSLRFEQSGQVLKAELVDASAKGFRIRYEGAPLATGAMVDVSYAWGHVKACVVWVREVTGCVEAGFFILHDDTDR